MAFAEAVANVEDWGYVNSIYFGGRDGLEIQLVAERRTKNWALVSVSHHFSA